MIRGVWLALLLGFALPVFAQGVRVVPLTAAEIPALLQPPTRGVRIIMLWSLDCAYCEPNMQALAKLQKVHGGDTQLITVATDNVAVARHAIAARLDAAGMRGYPARAYAAATPERMNFLIDPDWGGETPRTLVIRADGTRIGISGELTPAELQRIERWGRPQARR